MSEIFISPIKDDSGIWSNKQLIYVCDSSTWKFRRGDLFPHLRNIELGDDLYEVWYYEGDIYRFLFFFEGAEVRGDKRFLIHFFFYERGHKITASREIWASSEPAAIAVAKQEFFDKNIIILTVEEL